jgi:23S rRNA pseudouridine1911/1915/1917 synthase
MNNADASTYTVASCEAGQRLDIYIAGQLADCTRSQAARLIRRGCVRVDEQDCKPSQKVKFQERVSVRLPAPEPSALIAEPLALAIIFEDRDLLVIDKPAGMVVHPAAGHGTGTLVHGILHHCPDLEGIGGEKRPGIVHRLDKETSGVLVVAKTARAHNDLAAQFRTRAIQKQYLALVHGAPRNDSGRIDLPVGRHPVDRKKMSIHSSRARDALTIWKVAQRLAGAALLEIDLKTGRTHQIRVHCQAMGFPIIGDPVYGRKGALKQWASSHPALYRVFKKARRQMLHACRIGFNHPADGRPITFEAPLPRDMAAILGELRQLSLNGIQPRVRHT